MRGMERIRRRQLLLAAAGCVGFPSAVFAQEKVHRIGFLGVAQAGGFYTDLLAKLREELRMMGHVEGKTVAFEYRFADEREDRLAGLAAELVRNKVNLIVAHGTPETRAAKAATSSIPIVMASVGDPVGAGLVKSLARPGGNVTGLTNIDVGLAAKRLQLLKQLVPNFSRVALLRNPTNPSGELQYKDTEAAARSLAIQTRVLDVRSAKELEGAFRSAGDAQGLAVMADPLFLSRRKQIAELAIASRLPSIFARSENVEAGGMISYGPTLPELYRQTAVYVDKILKGANPGDLPIEQPTKFHLLINMKTASALGITIPHSVRITADRIIE